MKCFTKITPSNKMPLYNSKSMSHTIANQLWNAAIDACLKEIYSCKNNEVNKVLIEEIKKLKV